MGKKLRITYKSKKQERALGKASFIKSNRNEYIILKKVMENICRKYKRNSIGRLRKIKGWKVEWK